MCVCVRERERKRGRERDRERETERERQRQTDREGERDTETERRLRTVYIYIRNIDTRMSVKLTSARPRACISNGVSGSTKFSALVVTCLCRDRVYPNTPGQPQLLSSPRALPKREGTATRTQNPGVAEQTHRLPEENVRKPSVLRFQETLLQTSRHTCTQTRVEGGWGVERGGERVGGGGGGETVRQTETEGARLRERERD